MGCCSATVFISIFAILVLIGVLELTVVPLFILPAIVKSQAVIRQNPDGTFPTLSKFWSKLPVVQNFRFYMFNVTNPNEVMRNGDPVRVQEMGPYTYLETEYKTSIQFLDNGNKVYYKNNKTWVFSPEHSCPTCQVDDAVFNPNAAFMAVASIPYRQKVNPAIVKILDFLLVSLKEEPLRKTPVRNLLFDSYDDPLINLLNNPIFKAVMKILHHPIILPNVPAIGYFPRYNNSDDGEFVVRTGKDDYTSIAQIVSWNKWNELPWWKEEINRNLLGSDDGSFNIPLMKKTDSMRLFHGYICRMLNLKYEKDVEVGGIKGYRLAMDEESYDTTKEKNRGMRYENFENATYFPLWSPPNSDVHLPPGIIPLRCLPGKPIPAPFPGFFSTPHFVASPPEVIQNPQLIGMFPDPVKHSGTFLDIEPTTGATMLALARIQLNIAIHNSPFFTALKHAKDVIIPCLWLEIEATMNDEAKNYIWFSVTFVKAAIFWSGIVLVSTGCAGIVATFIVLRRRKSQDIGVYSIREQEKL